MVHKSNPQTQATKGVYARTWPAKNNRCMLHLMRCPLDAKTTWLDDVESLTPREGLVQSFVKGKDLAEPAAISVFFVLRLPYALAGCKTLYLCWILGSTESGSRDTKEAHTPTTPCDAA